jgi:hypothetical protein
LFGNFDEPDVPEEDLDLEIDITAEEINQSTGEENQEQSEKGSKRKKKIKR